MQPKQPQPQVLYRKYENMYVRRSMSNHFTFTITVAPGGSSPWGGSPFPSGGSSGGEG